MRRPNPRGREDEAYDESPREGAVTLIEAELGEHFLMDDQGTGVVSAVRRLQPVS
jgi:hypothetical protein